MSPENQWLEDVFPIEIVPFLGAMLVFGRVHQPTIHKTLFFPLVLTGEPATSAVII